MYVGKFSGAHQQARLTLSFQWRQTQMQIKDVESVRRMIPVGNLDRRVLTAATLKVANGEINIALPDNGVAAQSGIPISAFAQAHIVPAGVIGIVEGGRYFLGHILPFGAGRTLVDLLQQDNIRIVIPQDRHYPFRAKAPVESDGAVNIVGDNAQFQRVYAGLKVFRWLPVGLCV